MKAHHLPFENRWTNGEHAWQWHCELERLGLNNVRAIFADHEAHHADERAILFDMPAGFVRDWLAFRDRRAARQQALRWITVIALALVSAIAAIVVALRT